MNKSNYHVSNILHSLFLLLDHQFPSQQNAYVMKWTNWKITLLAALATASLMPFIKPFWSLGMIPTRDFFFPLYITRMILISDWRKRTAPACKDKHSIHDTKNKLNKAISMMSGKSPQSDVEMSKKNPIFPGGHLGFLEGISQSILTKLGTHIKHSLLNKFGSLRSI